MKKTYLTLIQFTLILLFPLITFADKAPEIKLVTGDMPPFVGKDLPQKGAMSEVVITAFNKIKIPVVIDFRPWARGYSETKENLFFGTFPYVKTPEREKDFYFSTPIYTVKPKLFIRTDIIAKNKTPKLSELLDLRLCSPIGFAVNKDLIEKFPSLEKNHLEPLDLPSCAQMLLQKRADYFIVNTDQGRAALKKVDGEKEIQIVDLGLRTNEYYLIVPKTNKNGLTILNQFNSEIQKMKKSGEVQKILRLHFSKHFMEYRSIELAGF